MNFIENRKCLQYKQISYFCVNMPRTHRHRASVSISVFFFRLLPYIFAHQIMYKVMGFATDAHRNQKHPYGNCIFVFIETHFHTGLSSSMYQRYERICKRKKKCTYSKRDKNTYSCAFFSSIAMLIVLMNVGVKCHSLIPQCIVFFHACFYSVARANLNFSFACFFPLFRDVLIVETRVRA